MSLTTEEQKEKILFFLEGEFEEYPYWNKFTLELEDEEQGTFLLKCDNAPNEVTLKAGLWDNEVEVEVYSEHFLECAPHNDTIKHFWIALLMP